MTPRPATARLDASGAITEARTTTTVTLGHDDGEFDQGILKSNGGPPFDPGYLKQHGQLADHFPMRRVVVGGVGILALGWALGSSDWRGYWSEFWTTARTQLGASDAITGNRSSMTDTSASTQSEPASLP